MRVGIMVASAHNFPLRDGVIYAPFDITLAIARGLRAKGHEVILYAPASPEFTEFPVVSGDMAFDMDTNPDFTKEKCGGEREKVFGLMDQYLLMLLYKDAQEGKIDIAHVHPMDRALPLAELVDIPTVYTIHDPVSPWRASMFDFYKSPKQHLVSISDAQRKGGPSLNYAKTVYNGVDTDYFTPVDVEREGFLFMGRILPKKGVKEAAQAATLAQEKLNIVGATYGYDKYWQEEISPLLSTDITYAGYVGENKHELYSSAKALLFPIKWEEPFGLVMTEAMACGTPVIAFGRGSVPEVVKDGVTGFIVDSVEEMAEAMKKIDTIDRAACRQHVLDNFSLTQMVEGYESLFLDLTKNQAD